MRRQLAIRIRHSLTGEEKEERDAYLELDDLAKLDGREAERRWQQGITTILARVEEIEKLRRATPEQAAEAAKAKRRMTVADAWQRHPVESRLSKEATATKEQGLYKRYYAHLADRFLDELGKDFWAHFVGGLGAGKLLNADGLTYSKLPRKELAEATIMGVMNLGAKLYGYAGEDGLPGKPLGWNPARDVLKKVGTPNVRTGSIPLRKLAEVWRAADVMCAPWARDHLRVYVLTGLRHALLSQMTFAEVDSAARVLRISPHKAGTKRRGADTPANAPDIVLPISGSALRIIDSRRAWAPDPDGPVWYMLSQHGGKPTKGGRIPVHSDPRSNWAHLSTHVLDGWQFLRHDLRRTFARIAVAAGADLMGTSLLMLHSPRTVARIMNIPDITAQYMNLPEAQAQMRSAARSIEKYVAGVLDGSITFDEDEAEPELPAILEDAVGAAEGDD
ncbi:hypothetical protein [Aquincola sp. J276]|uniref:hypothetical protein n=1 Tax=Aquincola sp. J276 TaxID=2898432 RepID=UPI0021516E0F|nr:hypothetical protein [Aquincola sp. J276]MCR5865666.1 hypothetical protein [Aquincola sp. J276]